MALLSDSKLNSCVLIVMLFGALFFPFMKEKGVGIVKHL